MSRLEIVWMKCRPVGADAISRLLVLSKLRALVRALVQAQDVQFQQVLLKWEDAFEDICAFSHRCANSVAFASTLRMSPCAIWWTIGAHVSL